MASTNNVPRTLLSKRSKPERIESIVAGVELNAALWLTSIVLLPRAGEEESRLNEKDGEGSYKLHVTTRRIIN